jgi:protoheme ferro-lyase
MDKYVKELEDLISETLLPVYLEHYRLLGKPSPISGINSRLLEAMRAKPKVPYLLRKEKYD